MACNTIKRKANFSDREIAKVVELCVSRHAVLTGKHGDVDGKEKNKCWVDIVERVNSVGGNNRTLEDVIKKWKDLKSQTKKKEQRRRREMLETGGGEAPSDLKDWEDKLITVIPEASLMGISGGDDIFTSNNSAQELVETIVGDTALVHEKSVNVQVSSIIQDNESQDPSPSSSKKKRTTMNLSDAQIDFYSSNAELAREKILLIQQQTKTEKERERFFKAAAGRIESSGLGDMYRLFTEQ